MIGGAGAATKLSRRLALLGTLAGCAGRPTSSSVPSVEDGVFVMPDGARLPYRLWWPPARVRAVALALHGMDDSRDAWEVSGPAFAAGGIAIVAPDQRGFGDATGRGFWPGTDALVADSGTMLRLIAARLPTTPLFGMGESMGAAVLMVLDAHRPVTLGDTRLAGVVLAAPAIWGRAVMDVFVRTGLFALSHAVPGLALSGAGQVRASDNIDALRRLSRDRLTIHATRMDAVRGLVDLMDAALAAVPTISPPALMMYGAHDQLVPPEATAKAWREIPPGVRRAFYPDGWHLLLRDRHRADPIGDVLAWIADPAGPLPSGADYAARGWLSAQS